MLEEDGVEVFDSTIALIEQLLRNGVKVGVATSSKNGALVLEKAGITELIGASVDGLVSAQLGLKGKPEPDIFVAACDSLGVEHHRTMIVEDATCGVQAGAKGRFGLTLGVARQNNAEELRRHGADLVVSDLSQISLCEIDRWFESRTWELGECVFGEYEITMKKKPQLDFWQLWNMSFGYVGIQFGFALQNANVSRIFETLGAKVESIPILWIAAPISGLLIQPIIGHMSDKTWNWLGRRKPYFLAGALLSSIALVAMPHSSALWFAAGMLWIMDASINVTMQPFRAFIGDMLPDEQRTHGFAMQTFFIGVSSVVASICPFLFTNLLHIANTAPAGENSAFGQMVLLHRRYCLSRRGRSDHRHRARVFAAGAGSLQYVHNQGRSRCNGPRSQDMHSRGDLLGPCGRGPHLCRLGAGLVSRALHPLRRLRVLRSVAACVGRAREIGQDGRHGRDRRRPAEHAGHHEAACARDDADLVRAVLDVHLFDLGGDQFSISAAATRRRCSTIRAPTGSAC